MADVGLEERGLLVVDSLTEQGLHRESGLSNIGLIIFAVAVAAYSLAPMPVVATAAVPSPTLSLELTLTPDPIVAPAVVPLPGLGLVYALNPDPVVAAAAIPSPTLSLVLTLAPTPVTATAAVPSPSLSLVLVLLPEPVVASAVIPLPSLASAKTLFPEPVIAIVIVPEPSIDVPAVITDLEVVLASYLGSAEGLAALIADRIYPMMMPQSPAYPCVTYQRISGPREHGMTIDHGIAHPRIQVDSWGKTKASAKAVATQARTALERWTDAATNPVILDSLLDNEEDTYEADTGIYRTRQDWIISHRET